jgi:hypothetical protein
MMMAAVILNIHWIILVDFTLMGVMVTAVSYKVVV